MFVVVEIQILENGNPNVLHFEYADRNKAFEKYHYILAEAAVSTCLTHTAIILTAGGLTLAVESFKHPKQNTLE